MIVFFDMETGGLDASRHPVIELAAQAVDDDLKPCDAPFHRLVKFDAAQCDPEALKINHYDPERWAQGSFSEHSVVGDFGHYLKANASVPMISKKGSAYMVARVAGHNAAAFDFPFLRKMFERQGAFLSASFVVLDTMQLAAWNFFDAQAFAARFPGRSLVPNATSPHGSISLKALVEFLGVARTGEAHTALSDVLATIDVARALRLGATR